MRISDNTILKDLADTGVRRIDWTDGSRGNDVPFCNLFALATIKLLDGKGGVLEEPQTLEFSATSYQYARISFAMNEIINRAIAIKELRESGINGKFMKEALQILERKVRNYIFQVAIGRDILCLTELQTFDIRLYDNDGKEVFRLL